MEAKFPLHLDGQEAAMIAGALIDKAGRCESITVARMYRVLASRVLSEKAAFHSCHYHRMAKQYDLPPQTN